MTARTRAVRGLVMVVVMWAAVACAAPSALPAPPEVVFTPVALPDGAVPEALAADGDHLVVGVRRDGAPQPPGLLRRAPDGALTELERVEHKAAELKLAGLAAQATAERDRWSGPAH